MSEYGGLGYRPASPSMARLATIKSNNTTPQVLIDRVSAPGTRDAVRLYCWQGVGWVCVALGMEVSCKVGWKWVGTIELVARHVCGILNGAGDRTEPVHREIYAGLRERQQGIESQIAEIGEPVEYVDHAAVKGICLGDD